MQLIPAIDLHDGKCVRLKKGLLDTATTYSNDPARMAQHWIDCGAQRIHVVDLDGALGGASANSEAVCEILSVAKGVPIQLGGGIRAEGQVHRWLELGVEQVVVGTFALEHRVRFRNLVVECPRRIALALDIRGDRVVTHGWNRTTGTSFRELVAEFSDLAMFAIVCTDVNRDGMLSGINLEPLLAVMDGTDLPLIASGGVRDETDMELLAQVSKRHPSLIGVICGTALYEGQISFGRTQAILHKQIH